MSSSQGANKRTIICINNFRSVSQVLFRFPSSIMVGISLPFYQVLEASAVEAFVEDCFDFVFGLILAWKVDWKWRR